MDWEVYDRYRSTLLLAGLVLVSAFLLAFQKSSSVQHLRAFLVRMTLPPQRFLSQLGGPAPAPETPVATDTVPSEMQLPLTADVHDGLLGEERRKVARLNEENQRLREALSLHEDRWPKAVVCHVVGRDPQKWFQEIVLDKGKEEGLSVDAPVVVASNGREALVGRVVETSAHVSKVMLVQDPLSSVAATVIGEHPEDGVVEGNNSHELILRYLDRGSQVKVGDEVVTSGLGSAFPPHISIGWIEDIAPDPRQLFLQATLRPATSSSQLRVVLVLIS